MPTLAHGNNPATSRMCSGFTLLELLVVITLIALASAVAVLALPDPATGKLEREATHLASAFEAARAEARTLGVSVRWLPVTAERGADAADFRFVGLPQTVELPQRWLEPGITAEVSDPRGVLLGPEPVIGPQQVTLHLRDHHLTLHTDGLGPFVAEAEGPAAPSGR